MSWQSLGNTVEHEFLHAILKDEFTIVARRKKNIGTGWEWRGGPCPTPKVCQINLSFFG